MRPGPAVALWRGRAGNNTGAGIAAAQAGAVPALNETIRKVVGFMRHISRSALVALVAVVAMSAVAVASASASEFVVSKAPGTLKTEGLIGGVNEFAVSNDFSKANEWECKKVTAEGKITALTFKTFVEKAKFSNCEFTEGDFDNPATVSEVEFEVSAEGWASLLKQSRIHGVLW